MALLSKLGSRIPYPSRTASPLPEKIAVLLRESRWLVLIVVASFIALSLWGYNRADPGWSHAVHSSTLHNPAGRSGAWLADLLLYLFGLSAWWLILLLLITVGWGYRRLEGQHAGDRRPLLISLAGFVVLIVASSGLETLRFYTLKANLPVGPGGIIGIELGAFAVRYLGYTGATLALVAMLLLGWSIFSGMSWITAAERVGTLFERLLLAIHNLYGRWQDRRIGREVAREREAVVELEKQRGEGHEGAAAEKPPATSRTASRTTRGAARDAAVEPVLGKLATDATDDGQPTEPFLSDAASAPPPSAEAEAPVAPREAAVPATRVLPVKVEKRIDREKQPPLFPEAVEGGMLPPLHLLEPAPLQSGRVSPETVEYTSRLIERKLADFGVQVAVTAAYPGPVITRYEIEPAIGVKGAQILNLAKDLARSLSLVSVRVVETVPGKSSMALELPNPKRQTVRLLEIISSREYSDMNSPLTMTLGKDIGGQPLVVDLAKMPHLLVAGTTGSGKSVGINAMILSLLYKSEPDQVRLILVDPKMLELSIYEGIPHLLAPVVVDMKQAANALNWCVGEMEKRYKLMSAMGVRNIAGLNHRIRDAARHGERITNPVSLTPDSPEPLSALPYIVVVIDELADLMMVAGKTVEQLIARLAQKARAAGVHLILATQRPSVDVITGLIKANIPTRISFQVSSKIDSRTILDQMGAETLLGQGDMLYLAPGTGYPTRVHGAFVADEEVHRVVDHLKKTGAPNYIDAVLTGGDDEDGDAGAGDGGGIETDGEADPVYDQAVEVVLKNRRASISLVQRHLRIGYNRSARLIEAMEKAGLVSAMDARGGREVLARKDDE
ncbi:DNA translocase FtsK 4TM domain-containing protein [Accumulibacter sp.]|uniref:DNA translocase FtsK n=1 Tax=Accumulibacter sp. TaxID=2053492 RepID=UPI0025D00B2C|nr:DNA translocase FtsK 4TM domain-containing protein [Accumulibacter sp.]MCM8612802.1 DNA translocase FtsK 4TM domain-containing protein [Accumulibacter sp.]MCM8637548.1 DNA translocase FtsK 4TM domain-containing protein [Accumulibacter sp.]MCM8639735.1 DNA translocase FtsK 4TM domain-containing protein [Accumulibacter sp.]